MCSSDLVKESEMESLSLLFDFANMINANEHPIDALKTMAPHITQVHIKDALIVKEPGGLGHKACISGQVNDGGRLHGHAVGHRPDVLAIKGVTHHSQQVFGCDAVIFT